ncbi:hypothetical protein [Blastococcus sp. Marseille-P5729]|uniref:hypothetical protein n=1 Tax=Blastococcus sp. Marseille-P5729 TaxID=2086582 RepID=UPI000D0E6760|nr:hypothetical protein [Blastococcus sp. Marseille-P5729]
MTIFSRTPGRLPRNRSRLAGSVPFADRDAVREAADLAAIRDARPALPADDTRRTSASVRNGGLSAVRYAANGAGIADRCGATLAR